MGGDPATIGDLTAVFGNILQNAIYLAGVAVIIMLLVGGFQFLTASGDKEATQRASKTITYAITGLVLVLCSWLIINLLGTFLGLNLSTFSFGVCLPGQSC